MPQSGFTGISYPFRVNGRGGCTMSTTSATDPTHIAESIRQIFGTNYLERPMEGMTVYSDVSPLLFEPNSVALQQVLKSRMVDALTRLEKRVECGESDIEFFIETEGDDEILYANITYKVILYQTYYTSKIRIGELSK